MMDTPGESLNGVGYKGAVNAAGQPPRRQHALDVKRRIVEETFAPGASVSIVARRHDVNANQVFEWRKQYRRGRLVEKPGAKAVVPGHDPATSAGQALIRIGVIDHDGGIRPLPAVKGHSVPPAPQPRKGSAVPESNCPVPGIEIELPGGIKVRVDAGIDEAALRRVLAVVREAA